jgi:hypothetical protein
MAEHLKAHLPAKAVPDQPAYSRVRFAWGKASFEAEAQIGPKGLLAVGGMVGAILLASAAIVRENRRPRRPS